MLSVKSAPMLLAIACSIVLLTASGCYDPYYVDGAAGYQSGYQRPYAGTVVTYQQPWNDYYYYPSAGVYFNYRSGYYYHQDRGRWHQVRRLPRHIHIYPRDRVNLRMRGDRPYLQHHEHRRKYRGHGGRDEYRYRDKGYKDKRYKGDRVDDRRYRHDYKKGRKQERHSGKSGNKRYKNESRGDDRKRSVDRHRRNQDEQRRKTDNKQRKADNKQRETDKWQRKAVEKQQAREQRRTAIEREIDAVETRVYGGRNSEDSSRNSGWYLQ